MCVISTSDVPGFDPKNNDKLHATCWAEHEDGSLIYVQSTENNRVVYSIFDMSRKPPIEYRDAMPETSFKRTFSWKGADDEKWTWHDKTPFDWDRVIQAGSPAGTRVAAAEHAITAAEEIIESRQRFRRDRDTAAERVARRLRIEGDDLDAERYADRTSRTETAQMSLLAKILAAVEKMGGSAGRGSRRR